jgi:hypothetical protein
VFNFRWVHACAWLSVCGATSAGVAAVCGCRDKYRVLERFEVQVPDAQLDLLDRLDGEWAKFQVGPLAAVNAFSTCSDASCWCPYASHLQPT